MVGPVSRWSTRSVGRAPSAGGPMRGTGYPKARTYDITASSSVVSERSR
ncbi:hypothetical protein SCYAM73S_02102 [Streptomyces cyaneofuscatus]